MKAGLLAVFGDKILIFLDQFHPLIVIHANGFALLVSVENPAGGFHLCQALSMSGAQLIEQTLGRNYSL